MKRCCGPAPSPIRSRSLGVEQIRRASGHLFALCVLGSTLLIVLSSRAAALQVVDAEGKPVADARVVVYRAPQSGSEFSLFHQLAPPLLDTTTDAEGRVASDLPRLRTLLLVDQPRYGPWALEIEDSPPRTVTLSVGHELRGKVDLDDGARVREGRICGYWTTAWAGREKIHEWRRCSDVAEDGSFTLSGLAGKDVAVAVWVPGFLPTRRTVEPDRKEPLEIRPERGHRIVGRVEARRQPIRGASVRSPAGARADTGTDGAFELAVTRLPTQLEVQAPGFRSQKVTVPKTTEEKDEILRIEMQPAEQLSGILMSSDGQPISRASFSVTRHLASGERIESRHPLLTTDDESFRLDLPGPGNYDFRIEAEGHRPEVVPEITLSTGQILDLGVVTLSRGAGVRGTLVDADDESPIRGAVVRLLLHGSQIFDALRRNERPSAISDETGSFEIWGLDAGRFELRVEHKGYAPSSQGLSLERDEVKDLETLLLDQGVEVSGTLVDRERQPRPALTVRIFDPEQGSLEPLFEGFSDGEGRFGTARLTSGRYRVNVYGNRLLLSQEIDLARKERARELELVVGGVDLYGRVTRNGEPVTGGSLSLTSALDPAPHQGKVFLRTPTGQLTQGLPQSTLAVDVRPDGTFHLADAPHGALRVTYYPLSGEPVRRQVLVPDLPRHELDLEIGGRTLQGRVVDAETGLGVGSATVRVLRESGWPAATVTTREDGFFEAPDLEPGTVAVEASAEGFATALHPPIALDSKAIPVEIALEPGGDGALSVRLVRQDGSPVAGSLFTLLDEAGRMIRSLPSDSRGQRRFDALPAGTYFVVWTDSLAGAGISQPIVLEAGEERRFEQVLQAGSSIEITCSASSCDGAPVDHVAVYSSAGVDLGPYLSGVAPALRFSSEGTLALGRLSPATYLLKVWTGSVARETVFTADSEIARVALP